MGGTTKLCRAALTQAHMPNRLSEDSQAFGSSSTHLNMAAEDNRMQALLDDTRYIWRLAQCTTS